MKMQLVLASTFAVIVSSLPFPSAISNPQPPSFSGNTGSGAATAQGLQLTDFVYTKPAAGTNANASVYFVLTENDDIYSGTRGPVQCQLIGPDAQSLEGQCANASPSTLRFQWTFVPSTQSIAVKEAYIGKIQTSSGPDTIYRDFEPTAIPGSYTAGQAGVTTLSSQGPVQLIGSSVVSSDPVQAGR